jgi:hypothetical protein
MKQIYQIPTVEVVRMKTSTHLLDSSQSYPAGAPVNANRNGYGEAHNEVW